MKIFIDEALMLTDENLDADMLHEFLRRMWGNNSPLAHIDPILLDDQSKPGKALYCAILGTDGIIGCAALKFVTDDTIEIGSMAIDPAFRGRSLSKHMTFWLESVLRTYVAQGFQVITYATLGSNVMNFVIPRMETMARMPVFPLNLAFGIVPIEAAHAQNNIIHQHLLHNHQSVSYTSTLCIVSTNKTFAYQTIKRLEHLENLDHLIPGVLDNE